MPGPQQYGRRTVCLAYVGRGALTPPWASAWPYRKQVAWRGWRRHEGMPPYSFPGSGYWPQARGPGMPGPYKAYNTSVKIANKTRRPWGLQPTGGGVLYNPYSL